MKVYIATSNEGKIKEIKTALGDLAIELVPVDVDLDETEDEIKKNGITEMVAISKAKATTAYQEIKSRGLEDHPIITDDSGIYIEGIDGPGINTKKFVKEHGIDGLKNVLTENQSAYFQSVISIMRDGLSEPESFVGRIDGHLSLKGNFDNVEKGFPFNRFFIPADRPEFMAEIPLEQRINYSHRLKAAEELKKYLAKMLEVENLMAGESFR